MLRSLEQVGWPSIPRSCCVSRVDPGGLLTGGTPGLVKRCPYLSWVFLFRLGSGWALSPHSLWPCVCSLCLPVFPHVASGPLPLSFGEGLASPLM